MPASKAASAESRRIRKREAAQNRLTRVIMLVCGAVIAACLCRYFSSDAQSAVHTAAAVAGTALYALSFSSLATGSWTIGMFPPAVAGALAVYLAALSDIIFGSRADIWAWLLRIAGAAAGLFTALFIVIFAAMFAGSLRTPRSGEEVTVVVLGCRLKGTRPGRMLIRRLDAAHRFLSKHPGTKCIVSGGRGDDEEATEAEAMAQYLREKGIRAEDIFLEDRSATTYENIRFSKELAEINGLPMRFAIASDRFHQLRARLICRDNGIGSGSVNAETAWYLALQFWSREAMCIAEKLIKHL